MRSEPFETTLPNRNFLSVKEAADYLGVCRNWMYERIKKNSGPPTIMIGKKIRIPIQTFKEWSSQDRIP